MKLFDYLQDCVSIAAVVAVVAFMTAGDDASSDAASVTADTATDGPSLASLAPSATNADPFADFAAKTDSELDRLEADLRARLSAPIVELDGIASDTIEASSTAERSGRSVSVPPHPSQADIDLSEMTRQGEPAMPWQRSTATMSPAVSKPTEAGRRDGGAPPAASRPMSNRTIDMLPPPPTDESEFDLQPFGASIGSPASSDLATAPAPPRRVR